MRYCKRAIDGLYVVRWKDAKGEMRKSLPQFIKDGLPINTTTGWLKYYDREKIVLASEKTEGDDEFFDLTMIPMSLIIKMQKKK